MRSGDGEIGKERESSRLSSPVKKECLGEREKLVKTVTLKGR
jgi:hypothetical protein